MDGPTKVMLEAAKRVLPPGYAIVPIEPTEAMLHADQSKRATCRVVKCETPAICRWKAMIEAAQLDQE